MRSSILISIYLPSPGVFIQERTSGNEQYNDYNIGKTKHVKNQVSVKSATHKNWLSSSTGTEDDKLVIHRRITLAECTKGCWPYN